MENNNRDKRFIVDLDGAVVDSYGQRICDAACELYGLNLKPTDFNNYDLTIGTSLTSEQLAGIFSKPGYYRDPPPMEHALPVLQDLYAQGYEHHIITARPTDAITRADTLYWLADHKVPFDSLYIMAHHGDHKLTADSKLVIAQKLNAGYAIEDNPFNARSYATICDIVFLVNNTLNAREQMPDNVVRINDFRDIVNFLNEKQETDAVQTHKIGVITA